jgi:hypothetical protein
MLYFSLLLSSFMTYYQIFNKSNTTGAIRIAGTAYLSGTPVFIKK